jgi:hypothetical protein
MWCVYLHHTGTSYVHVHVCLCDLVYIIHVCHWCVVYIRCILDTQGLHRGTPRFGLYTPFLSGYDMYFFDVVCDIIQCMSLYVHHVFKKTDWEILQI